jgi:hypothetical protein
MIFACFRSESVQNFQILGFQYVSISRLIEMLTVINEWDSHALLCSLLILTRNKFKTLTGFILIKQAATTRFDLA